AIVDQIKSFIDFVRGIPDAIEQFRTFMEQAELAYTTYVPMLLELEDSPELDEKVAAIEDGIVEKFDALLDDKMGDILEMFYIAPETPAEDLLRIIYDLPKGLSALE